MIVGYGIDIMSTARIEQAITRFGDQFLKRIYTKYERERIQGRRKNVHQLYTAYWATKEAVMKALGTGNRQGVRFRDIEVRHEKSGKPYIKLYGVSKEYARKLRVDTIVVSMSHLDASSIASVIFETNR